jgi:ATP-binding cassette subfamily C protein CydD
VRAVDPRLLRHASAARGFLVVTVGLGLLATALILAQAGLLAHALAGAARGAGGPALTGTLLALLIVVAARAAAAYGGEVAALRAAAAVKSQLRRALTAHALRLGPAWLGGQQPGEIATLATRGLDALDTYFARYLPQLVLTCLVPLAVLARVAAADWISAVVIAVTLPLIPVFAVLVGLHSRARTQRQWQLLARLGGHFLDVVEGLPTLKVFGRSRQQAQVIARVTGAHRAATMSTLRVAFLSALVLELTASIATALVAVEVGLRLLYGHLGYQTALLVLLLTPEAYLPLRNLGAQFHASTEGAAAAGRVFQILEVPAPADPAARPPRHRPVTADLRQQTITLNAVSLAYPGTLRPAVDEAALTIEPGQRIIVVGPSGAGKTSLLALLLRFAEPTSGSIEVGGRDLAAIALAPWRAQIGWVPQHPHLFAGTVADNIALGQPAASQAAVATAAGLAGAADFIEALPAGYQTPLGERALRLSAGQRQKIALARAFLRDAPLLLLDEPAAHLDAASAGQVMTAVRTLMTGRTVILVTHDQGWIGSADTLISLDHGRLAPTLSSVPEPASAGAGRGENLAASP